MRHSPESGAFAPALLFAEPFVKSCWLGVTIVTVVAIAFGVALLLVRRRMITAAANEEKK